MLQKLEEVKKRYLELVDKLSDPSIINNREEFVKISQEKSQLEEIVNLYDRYSETLSKIESAKELLREESDPELKDLAREELESLEEEREKLEREIKLLLLPRDKNDERNVIMEIRSGTGGEEAALFAADLFRMYSRYAERKGWNVEILSSNRTGLGGFKEVIMLISGKGAYSRLKYEGGVHRVQRVPVTESQGRIHTSAVSVAVLPEAEEVDVQINPDDLIIETFRASGHGGQHVNKTESAVRITHKPTGIVVSCQDERSQLQNKIKAMKILRARLMERARLEQEEKIGEERRQQVKSGDRSDKIRTYNFPQNRVTDHRIGLTLYKLDSILDGDLDEIIDALITHFQAEALANLET